jgi:hypothetical protein
MIAPEIIDILAEKYGEFTSEQTDEKLKEIELKQPSIFAYLTSEDETYLLGNAEKDILYYLSIVIWEAVKQELEMPQRLSMKVVDKIQFENWTVLEEYTHPKGQSLDDFFEPIIGYHEQAELLYFICDGIENANEDEEIITKDSLLPIFIMLKTVVDCLLKKIY